MCKWNECTYQVSILVDVYLQMLAFRNGRIAQKYFDGSILWRTATLRCKKDWRQILHVGPSPMARGALCQIVLHLDISPLLVQTTGAVPGYQLSHFHLKYVMHAKQINWEKLWCHFSLFLLKRKAGDHFQGGGQEIGERPWNCSEKDLLLEVVRVTVLINCWKEWEVYIVMIIVSACMDRGRVLSYMYLRHVCVCIVVDRY